MRYDQTGLHFALGKAYLDSQDFERAFHHLNKGNAIKRASVEYDAGETSAWMRRITGAFTAVLLDCFGAASAASDRPVFIIGMPRLQRYLCTSAWRTQERTGRLPASS